MNSEKQIQWLGINWEISPNFGWGVLGFNLAIQAELGGEFLPVAFRKTGSIDHLPENYKVVMSRILEREKVVLEILDSRAGQKGLFNCNFPVLHGMGNAFCWQGSGIQSVRGSCNIGIIFFEETQFDDRAEQAARQFDRILAGSTWNKELLRKNGVANAEVLLQGIDPAIFSERPHSGSPDKLFRVFSGGKLEYRKGQDIVIAAFREFHRRHPDSVLITAWHNPWSATIPGIEAAGHVAGSPVVRSDGRSDVTNWLIANSLPRAAISDLAHLPNHLMSRVYAQADLAVFPNRCEGGTNLVAMECMASGVPTVLSANTGHLDLIDEQHCYPLHVQRRVAPVAPIRATDGWGESDPSELAEVMDRVYVDRNDATKRGRSAARFMQEWTWRRRYRELLSYLEPGVLKLAH